MEPTVSCVMTVYNTARYVGAAVRSVLAQTFADFELIVIDDGSTDGSTRILQDVAKSDARIRLVSRPNTGIVKAANEGIALARGKYLARMDSDDLCVPHRFATQATYLDEHPDCVLVGSRVMVMDPYGSPVSETGQKLPHEEIDAELLTAGGGWALVQPSTMMRTEAVRAAGGYRGEYNISEDQDLFLRLAERGRVANIAEPLLWYRRHYQSVSHTQYRQQAQIRDSIVRDAFARRGISAPANLEFKPWRPPAWPEQARQWGWAAMRAGNVSIARKHAINAVKAAPLSPAAWKLMYCALRGK